MPEPVILGVTGGIGSGKTSFVAALEQRGALPFSADDAVHRLYRTDAVRDLVAERWGDGVLDDGQVDRGSIARIVFADRAELEWLESVLHPLVEQEWQRFVGAVSARGESPVIVAEVPLLFEAHLEHRYDHVVLLTAPLDVRIARVGRRASGTELASERAARQMSDADKARRADWVFANDGGPEQLEAFADEVLARLSAAGRS